MLKFVIFLKSKILNPKSTQKGFTIVELLVVIVVIGILAAITLVSYTGITQRATAAALTSDLDNASKQLKLYNVLYGSYPTLDSSNCPAAPSTLDSNYCLKSSSGITFDYDSVAPSTFHLTATKGNTAYSITNNSSPTIATTAVGSTTGSACPTGFIPVPGSGTYGTNDFCVMKYEAKIQGNDNGNQTYSSSFVPESRASGTPWVNITQTNAIARAPSAANCPTGCHLITEAEWMTIAQNVLSVASNWDNGAGVHTVGIGYIYSGHNDNVPANALEASADDTDGYYGTGNSSGNQKRTLILSNGEVIWDLSGNVYDWTAGTVTIGQPGVAGNAYASWIQWPNVTTQGTISPSVFPSGTGIAGSGAWTSTNGIGQLSSNPAETVARAFPRGGSWAYGGYAGVLHLVLYSSAGSASATVGFRVSR